MTRMALVFVILALLIVAVPTRALAKDRSYSIDQVDIDATVSASGALSVRESREFDFDGSFNGVYWKIPSGTYEGRAITPQIGEVGEYRNGSFVAFERSNSGENGTYEVTEAGSYVKVKIYSAHRNEKAVFVINYTDDGLASRYQDTSELYWKFVSDGWDEESKNVTCRVHLPVPAGEAVSGGENVRAWGHGPLDASVLFDGNEVVYTRPGVGSSEFAEARIAFPAAWLSGAPAMASNRLDTILSEEQKWADEANAKRAMARTINFALGGVGVVLSVFSVIYAVWTLRKYKAAHKAQFDDKYFRDVPTNDHPAVLGALYHDGKPTSSDLTASLMRLTDIGAMKLDLVKIHKKGFMGREKVEEDYCVTELKSYRKVRGADAAEEIDGKTMRLLFGRLAPLSDRTEAEGAEKGKLFFSDLERIAKKHPSAYSDAYKSWEDYVSDRAAARGFFTDESGVSTNALVVMAVLNILGAIAMFLLWLFDVLMPLIAFPVLGVHVIAIVVLFTIFSKLDDLSPEAVEVKAKLEALRRWLKDFTRLKEAVPNDVILWNRLLVMAVVLGVADEVIEQLKVVAPQMLEDPNIMPVYGWYYYGGPRGMPVHAFDNSMSTAHHVSTAALSSSSSSSGGGGGGGFSGGGGGGFGGGGGGGAF